jgi:L-2-hydroxyglutarate oxidase
MFNFYTMKKDVVIIGGGIVGLATAYRLLQERPGLSLTLVEKEGDVAKHQTGHNSGVIHSGIYYRPGSLRANNCITGYKELLDFCESEDIPFEICGKLIVATSEKDIPSMEKILQNGLQNGLNGIRRISKEEALEREPHINVKEAILVPQAGIIDYTAVSLKYAEKIRALGGEICLDFKVERIIRTTEEIILRATDSKEMSGRILINCAGLYSDKVAQMTGMPLPPLQIIPFRGEYYDLKPEKQYLVRHLVYPVPNPDFPFLGVHFTRMIGGGIEAGPNAVLAFKREGYSRWDFDARELTETILFPGFRRLATKHWQYGLGELHRSFSSAAFVRALRHLIPEINEEDLVRGGAGVRAMATDNLGNMSDDFLIFADNQIVNVCNAPSPAATASLAIGKSIAEKALAIL